MSGESDEAVLQPYLTATSALDLQGLVQTRAGIRDHMTAAEVVSHRCLRLANHLLPDVYEYLMVSAAHA